MSVYDLREGPAATVNVWTALTQKGSSGTVNALVVPGGMHSIQELWVAFCEPVPADTAGGVFCVALRGAGLQYGEQHFVVGGLGREETGNSSYSDGCLPTKLKVQIAVVPGAEIWVYGGVYGTDDGTPELAVGVVYSEQSAPERYYETRMVACGTLDTDAAMTADMSDTKAVIQVPGTCRHIYSITTAMAGIALATATGGTGYVRLRGAIKSGEVVMCAGSQAALSTTTGVSDGYQNAVQVPTMIEVVPGGQINAFCAQCGVDWGTPYGAVGIELGA